MALALVAVAVPLAGPVWMWVTTKKVQWQHVTGGHAYRGWKSVRRWGPENLHGTSILFYEKNGYKAVEGVWRNGTAIKSTSWNPDGTVSNQHRYNWQNRPGQKWDAIKTSPPWWWPVSPQTHPTAPWWKEEGR